MMHVYVRSSANASPQNAFMIPHPSKRVRAALWADVCPNLEINTKEDPNRSETGKQECLTKP